MNRIIQRPFFLEGQEGVNVVDKDHAVFELCNTLNILHPREDLFRCNYLLPGTFNDSDNFIDNDPDRPFRCLRDDNLVVNACLPPRQPETTTDINNRDNVSLDIYYTYYYLRRLWHRRDLNHAYDPLHCWKRQCKPLVIKDEDNKILSSTVHSKKTSHLKTANHRGHRDKF